MTLSQRPCSIFDPIRAIDGFMRGSLFGNFQFSIRDSPGFCFQCRLKYLIKQLNGQKGQNRTVLQSNAGWKAHIFSFAST